MQIPRIVIAGAQSGVGKTTITTGLIGALRRRGLSVQPFKVGPDYIDPSYHTQVSGNFCRNLDSWMISKRVLIELFTRSAKGSDIAIIEGVMGLFDSTTGLRQTSSTAELAKLLKAPVVLVIDASGMTRSAAALALGYKVFDKELQLAGVILNRVSGEKHAQSCEDSIESSVKVPVVGSIPENDSVRMTERHLGLIPTTEREELKQTISRIVDLVHRNVDLDKLLSIAKAAPEIEAPPRRIYRASTGKVVSIGVAFDEAFSFYYRDALDLLESVGARVRYFSPLHEKELPEDVSGLYIGGGFPEIVAKELAANRSMRSSVRKAAEDGMPIFAECGGLLYLTKIIHDFEGNKHPMVGVLDASTVMDMSPTLNYTLARVVRDNILSQTGDRIRGHEYHYSHVIDVPRDARFAYRMERGAGIDGKQDGWLEQSILAPYSHTHFAGKPKLARGFVRAGILYSRR